MNQDLPPERFTAHDQRDQKVLRYGLLGMSVLFVGYLFAARMGWLPEALMPSHHHVQTATNGIDNQSLLLEPPNIDPEPYLGFAYQGTRFRFDFEKHEAVVMRPDFQSKGYDPREIWVIPSRVEYKHEFYPVTALSATAFLYANGVKTVCLPPTLKHFNGSHEYLEPELEKIILQPPTGAPFTLSPAEFKAYVSAHYPPPISPKVEGVSP